MSLIFLLNSESGLVAMTVEVLERAQVATLCELSTGSSYYKGQREEGTLLSVGIVESANTTVDRGLLGTRRSNYTLNVEIPAEFDPEMSDFGFD